MGASDEESTKSFKVQDRRRFSAEGELKPEFSDADEAPAEAPAGGKADAAASPSAERVEPRHQEQEAQAAPSRTQSPQAQPGGAGSQSSQSAEITFATFLISLSTEALVHLGEMPDPATGNQRRDLPMAQHMIDILGLLREKTRGNLERDEEGLLDAILFDLRMKYVEIARRAS